MSKAHQSGTKVPAVHTTTAAPPAGEHPRFHWLPGALLRGAVERRFGPDEVIFLAGAPASQMYLVLEGRVRVLRGDGGRAHVLHVEGPGGSLGEVPLFEGTTYPATTIAAEPTRCLVLNREQVLAAVRAEPDVALALLARLAGRVRHLVERLNRNTAQSTLGRLAELLLARHAAADGRSFILAATQQEAAEELGTVRELVVRGLRTLRERGAIQSRGGGRYVVLEEALLREIAAE